MVRLYLIAEGQTEQTFADAVLKPHLANFGVYLHKPMLIAHARKKGKVHRGGGRRFQPMQNDIARLLKQESASDVCFTTMIDLYALHSEFPGTDEAEKLRHLPYERVELLERSWANLTDDRRFLPFIQLYEFEAYLFSDPSQLAFFYDNADSEIKALEAIAAGVRSPELINDGPHSAPSKRIIAQLPDYESGKKTVGPQAAERIGLPMIRSKCPHFSQWLTKLEGLGSPSP